MYSEAKQDDKCEAPQEGESCSEEEMSFWEAGGSCV